MVRVCVSSRKHIGHLLVAIVLILHGGLLAWSALKHSPVFSEVYHLPAGLSHLYLGHFDLFRVNPPLVRTVAALPIALMSPATDWHRYDSSPLVRSDLNVSQDFLKANGSRSLWFFAVARWACIPFSILGGYICFCWARELHGVAAGFLSLITWCSCPYILGHASLFTPDAHAAALGLAAGYVFWRWLRKPCWDRVLVAGLVLGLAELAKFTLLVLYPLWPLMWLLYRLPERHQTGGRQWWREAGQLSVIVMLSIFMINAGYGFAGSFRRLDDYRFRTQAMTGAESLADVPAAGGNRFTGTCLGALLVPVPKDYLQGIDAQKRDFECGMQSYLHGELKMGGWWYYYLYALAIKIPLGTWTLLLLAVGVSLFARGYSAPWRDEMLLLLPGAAILILVSSETGFSTHSRYVLPMLPFVFVWNSKVGRCVSLWQWKMVVVTGAALCWSVGSSLWCYPHSLSYFNELVGGPMGGHTHLLDSNIAWGQDLYFLKWRCDNHPDAWPLRLAYYGVMDPRLIGIEFTLPPVGPALETPEATTTSPERMGPLPGWYAIDMNHLHGAKLSATDGEGGWQSVPGNGYDWTYFEYFQPVTMAGYSIYIYHITVDEANQVRKKLGMPELPKDNPTCDERPSAAK